MDRQTIKHRERNESRTILYDRCVHGIEPMTYQKTGTDLYVVMSTAVACEIMSESTSNGHRETRQSSVLIDCGCRCV
jgi:hypothetical protein